MALAHADTDTAEGAGKPRACVVGVWVRGQNGAASVAQGVVALSTPGTRRRSRGVRGGGEIKCSVGSFTVRFWPIMDGRNRTKKPSELSIWPGFADHRSAEHCGMQKMPTWICRSSLPLQGKDRDRIDRQARMLVRSCCSRRFVPYVRLLHGRTRHLLGWVSDEASVVVARGT
jgi:hypothetical protein